MEHGTRISAPGAGLDPPHGRSGQGLLGAAVRPARLFCLEVDLSHPVTGERTLGHFPKGGKEQVDHVLRPALAILFVDQHQLPQVMRIAQAVAASYFR